MSGCVAPTGPIGFIGSISASIDCQADIFSSGAFAALASQGSSLSLILTGVFTIFVALIGYNMLLGRGLDIRSGTVALIKVGAVMGLATSWPIYHTLVYDVATQAPGQIVAEIGRPSALPGSDGTLTQRLDLADLALQQLIVLGPGEARIEPGASTSPVATATFNAQALGGARVLYLLSALLGIVSVRIVAALMLALGPYFIAFLLFENTRSLLEGWIRVIAGATIGAIGVAVVLAFELSLLEPWLAAAVAHRRGGEALPTAPTELLVMTALFVLVTVATLAASARLAAAFRLGSWRSALPFRLGDSAIVGAGAMIGARDRGLAGMPNRASATANAIASLHQREAMGRELAGRNRAHFTLRPAGTSEKPAEAGLAPLPTGRAFPRRGRGRGSASAQRRDRKL